MPVPYADNHVSQRVCHTHFYSPLKTVGFFTSSRRANQPLPAGLGYAGHIPTHDGFP
ncbi:protein of unknown function [Methylocaldum szegediense]|uniref:Uncharacterized protein n=1 Tax=Methylocaldum szegediense TaxID=73780 RepID=A0ABN8X8U8_9GAMM|nr:protein of unknown function [Methylocaldum szegediense]